MSEPAPEGDARIREAALPPEAAGQRLDVALVALWPDLSRSFLAKLLKSGDILFDGREAKPNKKVKGGERVELELPEPEIIEARPEAIPLEVLYEDTDLIVVNKPAGMVTHPSAGHATGTLVNALLAHCSDLSGINGSIRPGIVHRLDRETSGAIVAAKHDAAHQGLQEQFMARTVEKRYLALTHGHPPKPEFVCDGRIGRHPTRRKEMAVLRGPEEGRAALTAFETLQKLERAGAPAALILAKPKTGRTHQIRVHLAKAGFPILADPVYGRERECPDLDLTRHALHAWRLEVDHPVSGKRLCFTAPPADDFLEALRRMGGRWPME